MPGSGWPVLAIAMIAAFLLGAMAGALAERRLCDQRPATPAAAPVIPMRAA